MWSGTCFSRNVCSRLCLRRILKCNNMAIWSWQYTWYLYLPIRNKILLRFPLLNNRTDRPFKKALQFMCTLYILWLRQRDDACNCVIYFKMDLLKKVLNKKFKAICKRKWKTAELSSTWIHRLYYFFFVSNQKRFTICLRSFYIL